MTVTASVQNVVTSRNLFGILARLVRQIGREDMTTAESMLMELLNNRDAVAMFMRLLHWWPKATNPEGWVYKSHKEWWAELRIKQNQLPRLNALLEYIGVEQILRKAEGSPTKHYRLNVKTFCARLATALQVPFKNFLRHLKNAFSEVSAKPENGFSQTQGEREKTITTESPITPTNNVCEEAVSEAQKVPAISEPTARRMVRQYGPELVVNAVRHVLAGKWNSPAGVLVDCLRDRWYCKPLEFVTPIVQDQSVDRAKWDDDPTPLPPAPVRAQDDAPLPPAAEAGEWVTASKQLEIQLGRATFDQWVRGARLGKVDGNRWTIIARDQVACDMLTWRMAQTVREIVQFVASRPIELSFVVEPARIPAPIEI